MVSTEFVASYEHDASGIAFLVVRANVDFAETSPIRVIASIPIVDVYAAAGAAFNGAATVAGVAIEGAAFKGRGPGWIGQGFFRPAEEARARQWLAILVVRGRTEGGMKGPEGRR